MALEVDEEPFAVRREAATGELGFVFGVTGEGVDFAFRGDALDVGMFGEGVVDEVFADDEAAPGCRAEVVAIRKEIVLLGLQEERKGVVLLGGAGWLEAEKLAAA